MNAPDADNESDAVGLPPEALASGQRTLAAIVFTDTVGFSKLMSQDEELTLRLVGRDLDHMKATCEAFGGQVLKSTGDGLLMLFTSAVQAVACALEIQRDLQKRNVELPKAERLQHRIGIHLGDIFQHGGDVMGDGVNIAARLQAQAVPGGICLSKTVYDVVQNRLPFYVNDLGARKLKNIGKVTAYQISPAEEGATGLRYGAWYRWRPWVWGAFWLVVALVVMGLVYQLGKSRQHEKWQRLHHPAEQASSPTPTPVPETSPTSAPVNAPSPVEPASPAAANNPTPSPEVAEVSETEFQDASFRYMLKYDFGGMEAWLREHDWPSKSTNNLAEVCPQLDHLVTWAHQQLQKYTMDQPLKVVGREKTFYYWPAPFGGVKQKIVPDQMPTASDAAPATNDIKVLTLGADQIPPLAMVGIIHELIKEDGKPLSPAHLQLDRELRLFVQTYHIVFPNRKGSAAIAPAATDTANPGP